MASLISPETRTVISVQLLFVVAKRWDRQWHIAGEGRATQQFFLDGDGMANVSGTLFFSAKDPASGYDLWKTDGTTAGTVLVANGTGFGFQRLNDFTNVGGRLFFVANDGTGGDELWTSDGTVGGTLMLKDIQPGVFGSEPKYLTNANGTLLFVANDGTTGYELWKSDGFATGTQLVKDIRTGSPDSAPHQLTPSRANSSFAANNGTSGIELWSSDGTSNGTAIVKDIDCGATRPFPGGLRLWGTHSISGSTTPPTETLSSGSPMVPPLVRR